MRQRARRPGIHRMIGKRAASPGTGRAAVVRAADRQSRVLHVVGEGPSKGLLALRPAGPLVLRRYWSCRKRCRPPAGTSAPTFPRAESLAVAPQGRRDGSKRRLCGGATGASEVRKLSCWRYGALDTALPSKETARQLEHRGRAPQRRAAATGRPALMATPRSGDAACRSQPSSRRSNGPSHVGGPARKPRARTATRWQAKP